MKVWIALGVLAIGVLLVVVTLVLRQPVPTAPERLPGIPSQAVWAGGVDGGSWILCRVEDKKNVCTIFSDSTGEVVATGAFVLRETDRPASQNELQYDSFDGQVIHLLDGRVLEPLKGEVEFPVN